MSKHYVSRDGRFDEPNVPVEHKFPGHHDAQKPKESSFRRYVGSLTEKRYTPLRVIPVGGVDEVGGNSTIVEHGKDLIVVDCGMLFTDSTLPGTDYIAPDLSYVQRFRGQFHGIVITHGHLDHVGALSHILPKLNFPRVYAPKLAIGIMKRQFKEKGILSQMEHKITEYDGKRPLRFGSIKIDLFRVDHSIQDGFGLYIQTPAGTMVHTGDFRIDDHCLDKNPADLRQFAAIGSKGVDLFLSDSTNATIPGVAPLEAKVVETFEEMISNAKGRVFIATFSTLSTRINEIIKIAQKQGRTVFLNGRSMIENTTLARDLGFIDFKKGTVKKLTKKVNDLPDNKILIITTGTQGEELAGLTRMAMDSHPAIGIKKGDLVIHSGRLFPETTTRVLKVINILVRKGAEVHFKFNSSKTLHTSGHAWSGDLIRMMELMKPKHVMPIHGELFMRYANKELAMSLGVPEENGHLLDNGDCLELFQGKVKVKREFVQLKDVLVEKGREGEFNDPVVFERIAMRENGVLIIMLKVDKASRKLKSRPKLISRGFLFKASKERTTKELADKIRKIYDTHVTKSKGQRKQKDIVNKLKWELSYHLEKTFEKKPVIVPLLIEE